MLDRAVENRIARLQHSMLRHELTRHFDALLAQMTAITFDAGLKGPASNGSHPLADSMTARHTSNVQGH